MNDLEGVVIAHSALYGILVVASILTNHSDWVGPIVFFWAIYLAVTAGALWMCHWIVYGRHSGE